MSRGKRKLGSVPARLTVPAEAVLVLLGLQRETGREYGVIVYHGLLLYRAFLHKGKDPASRVPRAPHRGGAVEGVGTIARRLAARTKENR